MSGKQKKTTMKNTWPDNGINYFLEHASPNQACDTFSNNELYFEPRDRIRLLKSNPLTSLYQNSAITLKAFIFCHIIVISDDFCGHECD